MDGKIQGTRTYRDVIIYNTPELIPGLTAQIYWGEPNYQSNPLADTGLGAGSLGSTGQRKEIYSINYAQGPIKANLGYVSLDNTTGAATSTLGTKGVRGGASYDAGVVLVGAGFDYETLENGNDNTYMLNANIPFGQFSFGVDYASRQYSGVASNAVGTRTGYGLGARYQLSKTAAIWAQYWNYLDNVTSTENTTGFEVAIAKSF
jgi:hypothetical protein